MYEVIRKFKDLKDDEHIYEVGDVFPREGVEVSLSRIRELSGNDNKIGEPLIVEKVVDEPVIEEPLEEEESEEEITEPKSKTHKKKKATE